MNCKVEKTKNANEVKLELTVEANRFDEAMKKVYFKTAKYFNIPGFRKGKAPMNIVEKYYGKEIFYEDTFNELVPEVLEDALKENKIEAVSRPDIDVKQIGKGQDLIFTAVFQTKPEAELGKYKGIEIKKIEYTVKDKDVNHELEHMQEHNSRLISIEDRPVEKGDIATIDFEGFVDGVAFEGGKAENYDLEIGSNSFIPGFEDQVIGTKIDEEKDINVKFPEEYFSKELAGKDATFKVKVHAIKKKELPKLDDEFAKEASEFDTLKELKASIKERLEKEGLYLNGEQFYPKVVSSDEDITFDLIIISVKNYQLQSAIEDIKDLVHKNTIILPLLNGIVAKDILQDAFKDNQVLYGLAIKIDAVKIGNKITQTNSAIIQFGDANNKEMSEGVLAVKNLLNDAKINNQVFEDMIKTVWTKWMLNIGLNQVSAISAATYGVIKNTPELLTLVDKAMKEVMNVSQVCDINLGDRNWQSVQDVISTLSGDGKTSLLQDVENKRKTEIEYFSGTLIKLAKEHNIEVPVNEVLYNFINLATDNNILKIKYPNK